MGEQKYGPAGRGISRRHLIGSAATTALATWTVTELSGCGFREAAPVPSSLLTPPANATPPASRTAPLARPAAALGAVPAWRSAMRPRTWVRIGGSLASVDPERNSALNLKTAATPLLRAPEAG